MGKQFFPSFLHVGTAIWNFHSSESCDILEITTAEAKIVLPEFMNGRLVSVKSSDGSVLEEWEEAPPSTVQLPMIQSATWSQSPQYIYIYIFKWFQDLCEPWFSKALSRMVRVRPCTVRSACVRGVCAMCDARAVWACDVRCVCAVCACDVRCICAVCAYYVRWTCAVGAKEVWCTCVISRPGCWAFFWYWMKW